MSKYVIEDTTLSSIADAIRAKTGKTDTMTPEQMSTEIAGITTGGGSSADVRYVTFRNECTGEEFVKPVAVGDNCVDVVAKGLWATPTKESDAQYNYTFYGWGASDGGAADSTILQNITEDKTVYAIYSRAVRYYAITFYDEDGVTVLNTQTLAYGAMPGHAPTKDGYFLSGWTPEIVSVSGDASYVAVWQEGYSFASTSWEKIAEISEAGEASKYFAVGDTREESLGATYGTVTLMIMGFDHDDLADGSGKAGMSIGCSSSTIRSLAKEYGGSDYFSSNFAGVSHLKQIKKWQWSSDTTNSETGAPTQTTGRAFAFSLKELNLSVASPAYCADCHNDGSETYAAVLSGQYPVADSNGYWLRGQGLNNYRFFVKKNAAHADSGTSKYRQRFVFCI